MTLSFHRLTRGSRRVSRSLCHLGSKRCQSFSERTARWNQQRIDGFVGSGVNALRIGGQAQVRRLVFEGMLRNFSLQRHWTTQRVLYRRRTVKR